MGFVPEINLFVFVAGTYIPQKEVDVDETIRATVVRPSQAIKLRATKECFDKEGVARVTGEEWLWKKTGAYLPGAYEEVIELVTAFVLTEKVAQFQPNIIKIIIGVIQVLNNNYFLEILH